MLFKKSSLLVVFLSLLFTGCSVLDQEELDIDSPNASASFLSNINNEDDSETCAFALAKTDKFFSKFCAVPPKEKGPAVKLSVFINCKRHSDGFIYNNEYKWYHCLNQVVHPSEGAKITTHNGCQWNENGACEIRPGTLGDFGLEIDSDSPEGLLLRNLFQRISDAKVIIKEEGGEHLKSRLELLTASELFADLAVEQFFLGDTQEGLKAFETARFFLDTAIDFIPGISAAKDASIIMFGINPVTGENVSDVERAMTAGTFLVPAFLSGTGKGLVKTVKALGRLADSQKKSAKHAKGLLKSIDKSDEALEDLVDHLPCLAIHQKTLFQQFKEFLSPIAFAAKPCRQRGELTQIAAKIGQETLDKLKKGKVGFGIAQRKDYRKTYRDHYAHVNDKIGQVHHAAEQRVLTKYPGVLNEKQMHSIENLRGIPNGAAGIQLHQREIRRFWDDVYERFDERGFPPTAGELLKEVKRADDKFGHRFVPPIR
ncbi:MAG: pre-toxin TG domain-containing protein [Pseudobacteriovorax sp.]|nr:pre-toxin TG domain-containing protein [Pseudobacteriovorax sp.]